MRSHTGDRPYKCSYCGDQFARSDLLARHINKCHGGPSKSAGGASGRRKAASSRATTSKQACDQCVEAGQTCDGSSPCAKCINRKAPCTFVKFHRQTAPAGPGHAGSLSASLPTMSTLAGYGAPAFGYAQSPYAQSPPVGATASFAFSPPMPASAPPYPIPQDSREGFSQFAYGPGPSHFAPYRDTYEYDGYDYDGSSDHSGSVSTGSRPASSAGMSDYDSYHLASPIHSQHPGLDMHHPHPHPHSRPSTRDGPAAFSNTFGHMSIDDQNVLAGFAGDAVAGGVPFFGAGGSVAPHRQTHLQAHDHDHDHLPHPNPLQHPLMPLPPGMQYHHQHDVDVGDGPGYADYGPPPPGSSSASSTSSHGHEHPHEHEQEHHLMQRESETRELKEFWKAYMRTTPMTASTSPNANANANASEPLGLKTPSASASNAAAARAQAAGGMLGGPTPRGPRAGGGHHGHMHRMSSLPSVRTPPAESENGLAPMGMGMVHVPGPHVAAVDHHSQNGPAREHGTDDLRRYEAAVLARKAPELVLRKPAKKEKERGPTASSSSLAGVFGHGHEDPVGHVHGHVQRPSTKRLPSQALEPVGAKRRRDSQQQQHQHGVVLGQTANQGDDAQAVGGESSERRQHGNGNGRGRGNGHGHGRRLSAPASPTALGFVIS
ncbi:Zinc finger/binuclear cluster transcriptional regulator [Mycena chlorophos]|uniref:Zinc finger/binuclear cluster transcriptional regulator n=1 Tax=Mycena chlorophos TaxID=658473 RepID=A0A8H6SC75_MYCCL|nr:Zinc finger/binuclear cluster transcriptional regulator [Mycena chlorophos]